MRRAGALALVAALSACAIDDRTVAVQRQCESAPADGLLSDFSTSRLGLGDLGPTVSLGTAGTKGLFFTYRVPRFGTLELGLTGDLASVSDERSALRVVMDAGVLEPAAVAPLGGFAVRFEECVGLAENTAVTFRVDGNLGACPLRVGAQLIALDDDVLGEPCPLDECSASTSVAVGTGLTTLPLPRGDAGRVLGGLQWELGLPSGGAATCVADFTLDDLRLAP